jgi:hypothetical protein
MYKLLVAAGLVLLLTGVASAQYATPMPAAVYSPTTVYGAPLPYVSPYTAYYAPVVIGRSRMVYFPAPAVAAAPAVIIAPAVAPAPVVVAQPAVVAGPPAVIRSKVYYPGHPIRNTVRAVVP